MRKDVEEKSLDALGAKQSPFEYLREVGDLVQVRSRRWLVEEVIRPATPNRSPICVWHARTTMHKASVGLILGTAIVARLALWREPSAPQQSDTWDNDPLEEVVRLQLAAIFWHEEVKQKIVPLECGDEGYVLDARYILGRKCEA
jgi:hypothetical protein